MRQSNEISTKSVAYYGDRTVNDTLSFQLEVTVDLTGPAPAGDGVDGIGVGSGAAGPIIDVDPATSLTTITTTVEAVWFPTLHYDGRLRWVGDRLD